ncbi:MAG TPA: outer membrane protein assembly factor BamD [Burkholderiales bacterium]|nr:outer membrane protein assembly factor BamD [Burkholderiales bacterium]
MRSSLLAPLAVAAVLLLGACAGTTERDETANWSAQRLYGEARDSMASKDWGQAVKYFEKLEARYPYGRYAQQAQLEIAYSYWKDSERASAIAAADRFIKLYPNHPNVDYAYYLKGLINFNENTGLLSSLSDPDMSERDPKATREAFNTFKELATRFPDSKYTPDAVARMRYLVNSLALHEVHVARWYMRRGAYVAAANRAQYAVEQYPRAPATEEAIFIMVKAYDALGLDDLRDGAARVMRENFPHSSFLKPGGVEHSAPWWKLWDPNW